MDKNILINDEEDSLSLEDFFGFIIFIVLSEHIYDN